MSRTRRAVPNWVPQEVPEDKRTKYTITADEWARSQISKELRLPVRTDGAKIYGSACFYTEDAKKFAKKEAHRMLRRANQQVIAQELQLDEQGQCEDRQQAEEARRKEREIFAKIDQNWKAQLELRRLDAFLDDDPTEEEPLINDQQDWFNDDEWMSSFFNP